MSGPHGCGCDRCACGCCDGVRTLTPVVVTNTPGLDAIRYRAGTHARFLRSMLARLSSADSLALRGLRTRQGDDFSIALLDAWAVLGDVLTFYQERIATEGYLRTARERRSVLELARLVGYAPRPGVASSVFLAYTLDPGQVATIPKGSKAQSVPGPGELPQTFETSEDLDARAELSVVRPRLRRPQYVTLERLEDTPLVLVAGVDASLRVNDWLLMRFLDGRPALFQVAAVETDAAENVTRLRVRRRDPSDAAGTPAVLPSLRDRIREVAERYRAAGRFGVPANAAKAGREALDALVADVAEEDLVRTARTSVLPRLRDLYATATARGSARVAAWLGRAVADLESVLSTSKAAFRGEQEALPPITRLVRALGKPASLQPPSSPALVRDAAALYAAQSDLIPRLYGALFPLTPAGAYALLAQVGSRDRSPLQAIDVLRVKAALFGHNLPQSVTFNSDGRPVTGPVPTAINTWGLRGVDAVDRVPLDATYEQIRAGSRVAIRRPVLDDEGSARGWAFTYHDVTGVETITLSAHGVSSRVSVLEVRPAWLEELSSSQRERFLGSTFGLRATTVLAQNEPLELALEPLVGDVGGAELYLELDGLYRGLEAGRRVIVEGERADLLPDELRPVERKDKDAPAGVIDAELAMISEVVHRLALAPDGESDLPGDTLHTFVRFASPLAFRFERASVKVHANVVEATHGETRTEVLGHGDSTRAFQTFTLKQPPLTYVAAATARGAESTLELRVNEVRWHEAEHLAGLGPSDRRYVIRIEDEGQTSVVFGNGRQGARLPTGQENLRARYRSGIGKSGNVAARQISLLVTRPLGVKEVVNPLRAAGGADRETRDAARRNAPKGTKALDRLVSVQDYADFAEAFAGIGKASAIELSDGRRQLVHVTVAGADDIPIVPSSDLYQNLLQALGDLGDPNLPLELATRQLLLLVVQARVRVLPDYSFELVEPRLRSAMQETFGFERRALAQDVLQAEVLGVLQGVPGVAYVDLDVLAALGEEDLAGAELPAQLGLARRIRVREARLRGPERREGESTVSPGQLAVLRPEVRDTLLLSEIP